MSVPHKGHTCFIKAAWDQFARHFCSFSQWCHDVCNTECPSSFAPLCQIWDALKPPNAPSSLPPHPSGITPPPQLDLQDKYRSHSRPQSLPQSFISTGRVPNEFNTPPSLSPRSQPQPSLVAIDNISSRRNSIRGRSSGSSSSSSSRGGSGGDSSSSEDPLLYIHIPPHELNKWAAKFNSCSYPSSPFPTPPPSPSPPPAASHSPTPIRPSSPPRHPLPHPEP